MSKEMMITDVMIRLDVGVVKPISSSSIFTDYIFQNRRRAISKSCPCIHHWPDIQGAFLFARINESGYNTTGQNAILSYPP